MDSHLRISQPVSKAAVTAPVTTQHALPSSFAYDTAAIDPSANSHFFEPSRPSLQLYNQSHIHQSSDVNAWDVPTHPAFSGIPYQPVAARVISYAGIDSLCTTQSVSVRDQGEEATALIFETSLPSPNLPATQSPYALSTHARPPAKSTLVRGANVYPFTLPGCPPLAPSTPSDGRNNVLPRNQDTLVALKQRDILHNPRPQYEELSNELCIDLTLAPDCTTSSSVKNNLAYGILNPCPLGAVSVSSASISPLSSSASRSPTSYSYPSLRLAVISQKLATLHNHLHLSKNPIGKPGQCGTRDGFQRRLIGDKTLLGTTSGATHKTAVGYSPQSNNYCEICSFVVKVDVSSSEQPHITTLGHQTCCSRLIVSLERALQLAPCDTHCPSKDKPRHVLSQAIQVARNAIKLDVLLKILRLAAQADLGLSSVLFEKDINNIQDLQQRLKTKNSHMTQDMQSRAIEFSATPDSSSDDTRTQLGQTAPSGNRRIQPTRMPAALANDEDDDDDETIADEETGNDTGPVVAERTRLHLAVAPRKCRLSRSTRSMPNRTPIPRITSDHRNSVLGNMNTEIPLADAEMPASAPRRKYNSRIRKRSVQLILQPIPKAADDKSWQSNNPRDSISHIVGSYPINALKEMSLPTPASWHRVLGRADGGYIEPEHVRYARRTCVNSNSRRQDPLDILTTVDPKMIFL